MSKSNLIDLLGLDVFKKQIETLLGKKVDKETGKGLSTNDYTNDEKNKLSGIENNATANIGTITGIKMNGSVIATSGIADLGEIASDTLEIGFVNYLTGSKTMYNFSVNEYLSDDSMRLTDENSNELYI